MPSRTTKDTNAPKKPLTAYLLFSADERPKLKASGLDNFAEMSKALAAAWKQADGNTKVDNGPSSRTRCFTVGMF